MMEQIQNPLFDHSKSKTGDRFSILFEFSDYKNGRDKNNINLFIRIFNVSSPIRAFYILFLNLPLKIHTGIWNNETKMWFMSFRLKNNIFHKLEPK